MIKRPDDVEGLAPTFRAKVDLLLQRMRARGFNPVIVDGVRTAAEARANEEKGTGKADSLHQWRICTDWADRDTEWSDPNFFVALGEEAAALGLKGSHWGGNWKKSDRPHVQGVPATTRAQAEIRACAKDDVDAIDRIVRRYLA